MKYRTKRFVNIRGYVKEVIVCKQNSLGEWIVIDGKRTETVTSGCFYHKTKSGLILRDSVEFQRNYPNHPIEIEKLPI